MRFKPDSIMDIKSENQLVKITKLSIWFIAIVLGLYLISFIINSLAPLDFKGQTFFKTIEAQLLDLAKVMWVFLKPFLQVIFCILLLDFALRKLGIQPNLNFNLKDVDLKMKFPSFLLLIIVVAFALTVFYGIEKADGLKELALVVIGYYFGTQTDVLQLKRKKDQMKTETN